MPMQLNRAPYHVSTGNEIKGLRKVTAQELGAKHLSPRVMRTSLVLPSQHVAYSVCVEFAREWFMEKFDPQYFNSIYVEGSHSFDEFRKFSKINQEMRKTNPLLAIIPVIDLTANRDWIDSKPELTGLLRRSSMEGTFFNDNRENRGLHLQLMFKTITMNFTYKVRLDTRAEELDMMEFIKFKHRAGLTETRNLELDIHVPKAIISQIAFDNAIELDEFGTPVNPIEMLNYLNSYSVIPFIYKLRCSTGNSEYFIKVPNCVVHIKSEMPNMDDGSSQGMLTTNYNIDFNVEMQMTAPYCYTYYSQHEHNYFTANPVTQDMAISVMAAVKTDIPPEDENNWGLLTTTEYGLDDDEFEEYRKDPKKELIIDFKEIFEGTDLGNVLKYTHKIGLAPAVFINFLISNDGIWKKYTMDWFNMIATVEGPITHPRTVIGIYCDNKYINDTLIYIKELDKNPSRIY